MSCVVRLSEATDVKLGAAAWAFYKEHEEEVNWDMSYILPAYVRPLRPCSVGWTNMWF